MHGTKKDTFYLLAKEPTNIESPQHNLWETALKNTLLQVIDPEESDKIREIIEEKNASKFLVY